MFMFVYTKISSLLLTNSFFIFSKKYLALVSLAVIVRPTALIVWFPLLMHHFWQEEHKLRLVTHNYIPIGFVFSSLHSAADALLSLIVCSCCHHQDICSCHFCSDRLHVLQKGKPITRPWLRC